MGGVGSEGVMRNAPVPIVIYGAGGRLQSVNGAAVDAVDADDRKQLLGRHIESFVAPGSWDEAAARMARVLDDREPVPARELELLTVDGESWYAEVAGAPATYEGDPAGQVVLQDVTDRRRREQRLRRQRNRFTALFDAVPEPAIVVALEDGDPIARDVNEAFESVFGYDAETVVGRDLNEFVVPNDRDDAARDIDRTAGDLEPVEREVRRETARGELRDFLFRTRPVEVGDGVESLGIYVDVTDRKARQRELERQNERLDEFATVVSHDLRTPLSVATGNLHLYRDGGDDAHLDRIEESLSHMEALLEELLTLAREGEAVDETEPVDLTTVARTTWQGIEADDATLSVETDRTVEADPTRLREVFANLLGNAVEHGGDDVAVTVGPLAERGFYVADDGPGIDPDEREGVFDPGYTTEQGGTGFGLAIVEDVAEAHGWTVELAESESGGARFEFRIPPGSSGG
jgi:PAS domain S-box-containing protein